MSLLKEVKSKSELEGLELHKLPTDEHSQLSDAFILGMRYERKVSADVVAVDTLTAEDYLDLPGVKEVTQQGWDEAKVTDAINLIKKLADKHANEMRVVTASILIGEAGKEDEDVPPVSEDVKPLFTCLVTWVEIPDERANMQLLVHRPYELVYGELLRNRKESTKEDLEWTIAQSGQTLIPAYIPYGMVMEYVNEENPTIVGWQLLHMGKKENIVLATSKMGDTHERI